MSFISSFTPSNGSLRPLTTSTELQMGFLDGLFGGSKKAEAYHILLKGPNASKQCEKLKGEIYQKAIGRGDPSAGVSSDKLMKAFSDKARAKSTCPSKKNGGSLGSFGPGEMVNIMYFKLKLNLFPPNIIHKFL